MANTRHDVADVQQWDIWQVTWKHDDGTEKDRPALAISLSTKNAERGNVHFVKITGEDHPEVPCRLMIDPTDAHFKHTGLSKRSWIHFADEQPIPAEGLLEKRGTISAFTAAFARTMLKGIAASVD